VAGVVQPYPRQLRGCQLVIEPANVIALLRAGRLDAREGDVKLLAEKDRPGADHAINEEARLSRLATDLKALGLKAVPTDDPA
jgi:hypothetical protein